MIAKDAIKAWQLRATIMTILFIAVTIGAFILAYLEFISIWIAYAILALTVIDAILEIFIIPKLRWRRWRYEVFEQEIYIQRGIIVMKRTLVPMIRVQHVDTKDRKSTRLNSSHVRISYAVFCLKKKSIISRYRSM